MRRLRTGGIAKILKGRVISRLPSEERLLAVYLPMEYVQYRDNPVVILFGQLVDNIRNRLPAGLIPAARVGMRLLTACEPLAETKAAEND